MADGKSFFANPTSKRRFTETVSTSNFQLAIFVTLFVTLEGRGGDKVRKKKI